MHDEGFPAAEFVVSIDHGLYDKGLIVRATNRVYQLHAVGKTNPPVGYDHFKASFHIVQPGHRRPAAQPYVIVGALVDQRGPCLVR